MGMSVTPSEYECLMCYRDKNMSWNNGAFIARQRDALRAVDERIDPTRLGLKDAAIVFASDMEVKNSYMI